MSKVSWAARLRHDSDVLFREWGSDISSRLTTAGLVQTSDTGQINWATVTRASTNSNAGYEVWRFDDTLQSTAPIFVKIFYGTGGTANASRMQWQVGTGSDGSGNLTGTTSGTFAVSSSTSAQTSDTTYNSYLNYDGSFGFLGLAWKVGANAALVGGNTEGFGFICRTVDGNGDPTADGCLIVASASNSQASQAIRFISTAVAYTQRTTNASMQLCIWTQSPTTSVVGSDFQAALAFTITPRQQPVIQICGVIPTEITDGNTFSATLIGSDAHTYVAVCSARTNMDASGTLKPAMLWD